MMATGIIILIIYGYRAFARYYGRVPIDCYVQVFNNENLVRSDPPLSILDLRNFAVSFIIFSAIARATNNIYPALFIAILTFLIFWLLFRIRFSKNLVIKTGKIIGLEAVVKETTTSSGKILVVIKNNVYQLPAISEDKSKIEAGTEVVITAVEYWRVAVAIKK